MHIKSIILALAVATAFPAMSVHAAPAKPVRVLIVSGGGWHNYPVQRRLLEDGLKAQLNVEVSHLFGESSGTDRRPIVTNSNYGDGYDVIIHNECASEKDDWVAADNALAPHRRGIPAVNLHCAMHSYRFPTWQQPLAVGAADARWYAFTGIQSTGHGPQLPIKLSLTNADHPIAKGLELWTTPNEELYNNLTNFGVTPILTGAQPNSADERERGQQFTVAWTHEYGPAKAKVFSLTLAHNETTMADLRYLNLVARGVAWATGHLNADGSFDAAIRLQK
jgi:type 1 glutamine amidotransferase